MIENSRSVERLPLEGGSDLDDPIFAQARVQIEHEPHVELPSHSFMAKSVGVAQYLLRRLVQIALLIVVVLVLNFVLINAAPGDPVDLMAPPGSPPEYREQIAEAYGLDRPALERLIRYLGQLSRGDLGYSLLYRESVTELIKSRVPPTLLLTGVGFLLSTIIGVSLGTFAGRRAGSHADRGASLLALVGYSLPVFWLAQLSLIAFGLKLGWFPTQGMTSLRSHHEGLAHMVDVAHHLVLPVLVYSVYPTTLIFLLTRAKLSETLDMDFITTARSKGLSERRIVYRHALPNALLPVLTVIGYNFGFMLAGSILVETVFGWPGMGTLFGQAISGRDYPLLLGLFAATALMVAVANLLTDVVVALVDPRIRYGGRSAG